MNLSRHFISPAIRKLRHPIFSFSKSLINTESDSKPWIKSRDPVTMLLTWVYLDGFKKFASRTDVSKLLDNIEIETLEAVLDVKLSLTGQWAVLLSQHSVSKLRGLLTKSENRAVLYSFTNFDLDKRKFLASSKKIDNKCIKMSSCIPLKLEEIEIIFEDYELDKHEPLFSIDLENYIVRFSSSAEAQRAIFEKCFTPIGGKKSEMFWYDI